MEISSGCVTVYGHYCEECFGQQNPGADMAGKWWKTSFHNKKCGFCEKYANLSRQSVEIIWMKYIKNIYNK